LVGWRRMKQKLSITVDDELLNQIKEEVAEGRFRNLSHMLEYALKRMLKNDS
jgi:Arc/MetJ-type ribon-helix-helix transcriptional regulator